MDTGLQTALIAAAVGLTTAAVSALVTWRLERRRWLTGLKASIQVEVHKARMQSYPAVFAVFGRISTRAVPPLDARQALDIANALTEWIYSSGGMAAEAGTRGALLLLRERLHKWHQTGNRPGDFYEWRNRALLLLRRDIDVRGLESFGGGDDGSLLAQVRRDADEVSRRAHGSWLTRLRLRLFRRG